MIDFSVVIPSYKTSFDVMEQTIESVLSQQCPPKEIIVIDDNGNDLYSEENQKLQKKYGDKLKVFFNDKNSGANFSRNRGVDLSSSAYIAFLDSDDTWSEDYLKNVAEIIQKQDAKFVTTNYQVVHEDGVLPPEFNDKFFVSGDISKKELYQDLVGPTSTVVIAKDVIQEAGLFDVALPARQDYDMWLRVTKIVPVFYNYKSGVKVFRVGRTSISSSYKRNVQGTQMVLDKILKTQGLNEIEKKHIRASHLKHMALACILCNAYKESRCYAKKSLKNKFDKKLFLWYVLSFCPPLFTFMRLARRKILYKK